MIKNKKQVETASPPYIVEKGFFEQSARDDLLKLAQKFTKGVVILSEEEMSEFKSQLYLSEVRSKAGKQGGRPKLPDLTEDQIQMLPHEERAKYMMRIYKRNQRLRDAQ